MCGRCMLLERRGPDHLSGGAPRPNPNALLLRRRRLEEIQMEVDGQGQQHQQRQAYPLPSYHTPVLFDSNAQFCGILAESSQLPSNSQPSSSSSTSDRPNSIVTHDGERHNLIDCEHCGRTFIESKIFIHQRTCTASQPSVPNVKAPLEKRNRKLRSSSSTTTATQDLQEKNNHELYISHLGDRNNDERKTVFDTVDLLTSFHERRKQQYVHTDVKKDGR